MESGEIEDGEVSGTVDRGERVVVSFIQTQSFRLLPFTKNNVEWELSLSGDTAVKSKNSSST